MNRLIRHLLAFAVALSCASCVTQFEKMDKGTPTGEHYTYLYNQIGGKGTGQSSMGTAVGFDGEKSFADAAQAVTAVAGLSYAAKQTLYKEVTKRYEAGQLTIQKRDALNAAIAQSETAAQLQVALAQIAKLP